MCILAFCRIPLKGVCFLVFFCNDPATTEIYTLSLHDALPIYDKTGTRYIPDLGGLAGRMPVVAVAMLIAGLASLGLPGLSGFVSELLVFLGAFQAYAWPTVLAVLGIVLAAGYILWMMERTFFGVRRPQFDDLTDASFVEAVPLVLMVMTIIGIGVWPTLLTDVFESGLNPMVDVLNGVINP